MNEELVKANADIMTIVFYARKNGWGEMSVRSIHRITYLLKVLYSFITDAENIFLEYHFSVSPYGPYSDLVNKSVVFLLASQRLEGDIEGCVKIISTEGVDSLPHDKINWIDTILLILSKYGEEKLFGFIVNDPLYDESVKSGTVRELEVMPENATLALLNDFKKAFEETLPNAGAISKEEYISLYFDYIFSQIIK